MISTLFFISPKAYADDAAQFDRQIQAWHASRAKVETQLGLDPQFVRIPEPTCYYDDLEAHYEQVLIMSDFIDQGIR